MKKAKFRGLHSVLSFFLSSIPWLVWLGLLNSVSTLSQPKLVPVPLTTKNQRERGYNQSELITHYLNYYFGLPVVFWVEKTKTIPKQSMLAPAQRRQNVLGAYRVKKDQFLKDQDLILVDDVITTGSTINEIGLVLKKAGAGKLIAWSLFRAH